MSAIVKSLTSAPRDAVLSHGWVALTDDAKQITPAMGLTKGVLLYAPGPDDDTPNTVIVYLGGSGVTADQAATGGLPLAPGQSVLLPMEDARSLYAICPDSETASICFFAV